MGSSMHCPTCDKDVNRDEILKGFNIGNEKAPNFIVVTTDDRHWNLVNPKG